MLSPGSNRSPARALLITEVTCSTFAALRAKLTFTNSLGDIMDIFYSYVWWKQLEYYRLFFNSNF
ncbi:hypothetical protein SIPHO035v1_p0077 [Vibrio phage 234P7B]|nr:hypothetical protein SIPHO035v1_p0077 [Vibrio phage 234P7B]